MADFSACNARMNKHPSADADGCRIENGLKSWDEFLPDWTLYKVGEMFTMYAVPIFTSSDYNNGSGPY